MKRKLENRATSMAERVNQAYREGVINDKGQIGITLSEVPHAPFDFEQEGETYRVRGERNGLGLYWLGEDGEQRKRSLAPGELETFWAKRIIK